jgi:hypothetical protein
MWYRISGTGVKARFEFTELPEPNTSGPACPGPKDRRAKMLDELVADLELAGRAVGNLAQPHLTQ